MSVEVDALFTLNTVDPEPPWLQNLDRVLTDRLQSCLVWFYQKTDCLYHLWAKLPTSFSIACIGGHVRFPPPSLTIEQSICCVHTRSKLWKLHNTTSKTCACAKFSLDRHKCELDDTSLPSTGITHLISTLVDLTSSSSNDKSDIH
jgi:hypothetical protein